MALFISRLLLLGDSMTGQKAKKLRKEHYMSTRQESASTSQQLRYRTHALEADVKSVSACNHVLEGAYLHPRPACGGGTKTQVFGPAD